MVSGGIRADAGRDVGAVPIGRARLAASQGPRSIPIDRFERGAGRVPSSGAGPTSAGASPAGIPSSSSRLAELQHALDAERSTLPAAALAARIGPSGRAYLEAAGRPPRASLLGVFRAAADGIFGARAGEPIRYIALRDALRARGLGAELEALLGGLDPAERERALAGELSPRALFEARARALAGWRASPLPIDPKALARQLERDGDRSFARVRTSFSAADRARLEAGRMSPIEYVRLAEKAARHDVDAIIIGSGMAGLAAAAELTRRNWRVVVLEARDRVGGRTLADEESFEVPFDHGAAWLHTAAENPLTPIAAARGFTTVADVKHLFAFDGTNDPREGGEALGAEVERITDIWAGAAARGKDVAAGTITPTDRHFSKLAAAVLGPLELAVDVEKVSTKDFATIKGEHGDLFVKEGVGALVASFSHGLPIELNAPVSKIEWGAEGVRVRAGGESYRGKLILVTASPGVLNAGKIEFDPPLPPEKTAAFAGLAMGSFDKIALSFSEDVLGDLPAGARLRDNADPSKPIEFVVRPFGKNMVIAFVGGSFGKALIAKGDKAAVDFAASKLESMLGPGIAAAVDKSVVTRWSEDPWTLGAYSAALPGRHHLRASLAKPVEGRVFFAGEATHGEWAQHVAGAFLSGERAADEMAEALYRGAAKKLVG